MICFACPVCNKVLSVPDSQKGAKLPCPRCGQRLQVPANSRDKTVLGRPLPRAAAAAAQRAAVGAAVAGAASGSIPQPPPAPPEALWYYAHAGLRFGPVSWATLQQRVSTRHIEPADLVWTPGMTYWSAANLVPGLFPDTARGPAPVPMALPASVVPPPLPALAKSAVAPRPRSSSPIWQRVLRESKGVALATVTFPWVLLAWPFRSIAGLLRRRSLRHSALEAQALLGKRLHEMKVGDPSLRGQINTLGERLLSLEASMGNSRAVQAERRGLLLRLAGPFLVQEKPPAGAESEHGKARAAQAALLNYQEERAARPSPPVSRGVYWRRIGTSCGLLGCIAFLILLWADPINDDPAASDKELTETKARRSGKKQEWTVQKPGQRSRGEKKQGEQENLDKKANKKPAAKKRPAEKPNKPAPERIAPKDPFATVKASVALVRGDRGRACGFLVRPNLLATTYTVVHDTARRRLEVYFPSAGDAGIKPLPYKVVHMDRVLNLALLSVKADLPALPLAERHTFQRKEKVTIISNPDSGDGDPGENVVLQGRWVDKVLLAGNRLFEGLRLNSKPTCLGGPMVNAAGKITGMITFRDKGLREVIYGIPLGDLQRAIRFAEARK